MQTLPVPDVALNGWQWIAFFAIVSAVTVLQTWFLIVKSKAQPSAPTAAPAAKNEETK